MIPLFSIPGKLLTVILSCTLLFSVGVKVALAYNVNGSGTCWNSGYAWSAGSTTYRWITTTIPSSWNTSIQNAANTWNNVTPSSFIFTYDSQLSNNKITKGAVANNSNIAETTVYPASSPPNTLLVANTVFNQNKSFTTALPPPVNTYIVQNVMTHEFGHWIFLADQYSSSCSEVTMYGTMDFAETKKQSLETPDKNGINYQYP